MKYVELGKIIASAKVRRAGNTNYPVLSMTMRDGLVNQADKFKKRIASADTSPYKVVEKNQLVVGFPIDEGVLAFQNLYDEAIVSPAYNIWNLQKDAPVDSKYLEGFLRSPRALAFYKSKLQSTTARRRSIPNDEFLSLLVPMPSLLEQKRLLKLLDEADELRKLCAQASRRTATLIPALFHEMFGDPEHTRLPVKQLVELVVPERPVTYGILKPGPDIEGGVPYVRVLDIKQNHLHVPQLRKTTKTIANEYRRSTLCPGDILVTIRGTVGRTCIVPEELKGANITQDTARLALIPAVETTYVVEFLNTTWAQDWMSRHMLGQAVKGINLGDLRKLPVPIPPLPLQRKFAQRVTTIRQLKAEQAVSDRRLNKLFESMLHRAFIGEL